MSVWSEIEALPKGKSIVHVGLNDWEIGKNFSIEYGIHSNVKIFLLAINKILKDKITRNKKTEILSRLKTIKNQNWTYKNQLLRTKTYSYKKHKPIKPDWLMMNIVDTIPNNAIIVEEALTSSKN